MELATIGFQVRWQSERRGEYITGAEGEFYDGLGLHRPTGLCLSSALRGRPAFQ